MTCTEAGLAVFHKWTINHPGSVMSDVIRLKEDSMQITLRWLLAITASVAVLILSLIHI